MPGGLSQPPAPATLSGNPGEQVRIISAYLNSPTRLERDLRTLTNQQFVGDRILRGRATANGGMIEYGVAESIYADQAPDDISPLAEYPLVGVSEGQLVLEALGNFGFRTRISLESVRRRGNDPVVKARLKLANSLVQRFDQKTMARINAAKPSMLTLAGSSWTGSSTTILRQLLTAQAMIKDQMQGYNPKAILLDNTKWAVLASDKDLQQAMHRETVDTPVYTGELIRIAGLEILPAPTGMAADPIVFDPDMLGSIVREDLGAGQDANGVSAATEYHGPAAEKSIANGWTIATDRRALPIIQEPKSAVVITGTA